jgi:hypothetical protein
MWENVVHHHYLLVFDKRDRYMPGWGRGLLYWHGMYIEGVELGQGGWRE